MSCSPKVTSPGKSVPKKGMKVSELRSICKNQGIPLRKGYIKKSELIILIGESILSHYSLPLIQELPEEIERRIFGFLPKGIRYVCSMVCREWNDLLSEETIRKEDVVRDLPLELINKTNLYRKYLPECGILAAKTGRVDILRSFKKAFCSSGDSYMQLVLDEATSCGALSVVKWIYKRGFRTQSTGTFDLAIESGNEDMIEWMFSVGFPCDYQFQKPCVYGFGRKRIN